MTLEKAFENNVARGETAGNWREDSFENNVARGETAGNWREDSFENNVGKGEMLVSSIFSYSRNVFFPIKDRLHQFNFKLSSANAFNPFLNTPFWDCPKFKEAEDDNWNVAIEGF